ncbi:MAG TPA: hypothetical protein VGP41_04360 [Candidatus Lustribacter sp.]|nr:hypothetical protein [Candidatus Lustribacter sp.]
MKAGGSARPDPIDRIASIAAGLPLLIVGSGGNYEVPDPVHFIVLIAGFTGLAGALLNKRWAGLVILLTVLALGVYSRALAGDNRASDVMLATNEALSTLASGQNPYAHVYAYTNPPGSLFGYPPGELAFYGLAWLLHANILRVDMIAGIVGLGVIASLSPLVGDGLAALAVGTVAVSVDVIFHSTDGSNDTAASLLVLIGIVTLAWSFATSDARTRQTLWWTSAVAFGWVVAFKEYALPIAVFVALFLWRADARRARGWIAAAVGTVAVFVLPFLVWNPVAFVSNVGGALLTHHNIWGRNLWHDILILEPGEIAIAPLIPALALFAFAGAVVWLWRRPAANLGAAFLQGCALVAFVFFVSRWTTSVYYVFLTPLAMAGVALMLGAEREALPAEPSPPPR